MKKNDKLVINISTTDKHLLKFRSEICGMTLSKYCLSLLMQTKLDRDKNIIRLEEKQA